MPVLGNGEFYFATDTAILFVGFMGGTVRVKMAVQIQDSAGNNLTSTSGALDVNFKSSSDTTAVPISAVALPLPTGAATDLTVTNGTQKSQIVSPTGTVADVTAHGTQGANFLAVQNAKDSGRTPVVLVVDNVAGVTTEALATLTINKGGTVTSGTSYTVTAGKTFRLTQMVLAVINPSTTNASSRVRVRAAATVLATSPIYTAGTVGAPAAIANAGSSITIDIPDGVEVAAGQQVGISHIESSAIASGVNVCVIGFEY